MAVKTTEKQIGDNLYSTTTFTGTRGLQLLKRLTKVVGPSLAIMLEGGSEEAQENADGVFVKAIKMLVENIDKDDVVALIKELVQNTKRNGNTINFDIDFAGEYAELFQVVLFVVQENYGNFFKLAGSNEQ